MNTPLEIMIVEDDTDSREYLEELIRSFEHSPRAFAEGPSAVRALAQGYTPAIALLDIMMPGMNGVELLTRLKAMSPTTVALMLSALEDVDTVVQAVRAGAFRYLVKPVLPEALKIALDNAVADHELEKRFQTLEVKGNGTTEILTGDREMIRLQEIARRVADTDIPVLVTGESGVGKEVLARFIHTHSNRKSRPFVKVNCAALPHDLLESELFGHERGSFTGAVAERAGRFEMADKGTIFLDEIGDMSAALQAKLLHVLQDGEFARVGGRSMKVDARVVAATNKRLEEAVRRKEFREDLYFRLNVVRMVIPPLRERPSDVPLLAEHFFRKFASKYKTKMRELPEDVIAQLTQHNWPGNVRELENVIKRYVVLPDLPLPLGAFDLGATPVDTPVPAPAPPPPPAEITAPTEPAFVSEVGVVFKDAVSVAAFRVERELILRTLQETNWNRKEASRRLGVCYKVLLNKLKKMGLSSRAEGPRESGAAPQIPARVASEHA